MNRTGPSLWEATAEPAPDCPPLVGEAQAEVAIVGAGYTGLATAIALAEKGVDVRVLEAAEPGAGASGRNGGQVIPGIRHFPDELVVAFGPTLGRRLYEFGLTTADAAFALIARHGIRCDAVRTGWIQPADQPAAMANARLRAAQWRRQGHDASVLEPEALHALTGGAEYIGGWMLAGGGSVQPLSYARGLARAATALGAKIHGRSPVTTMVRIGDRWRLATPDGAVAARRVLLATNALTGDLWPGLRRAILPVWSFQIATAPMPAALYGRVLPGLQPVSDTREVLRYFRRDRDGRIVVGGKGRIGGPRGPSSFSLQRRMLRRLYPELAQHPLEFAWGGRVAITADRLPRVFELAPGVLAAFGCNGKGVALCSALGEPLAAALAGQPLDTLPLPVLPLRPIPLHGLRPLYVAAGGAWLKLKDA